jgi:DNA polymerase IV
MPTAARRIAHLDMDAFYASVELLRYPQLQGLPLVIGGGRRSADDALRQRHAGMPEADIPVDAFPRLRDYTGRGVITTATYAARQFGVGSAMGLMKAAQRCPDAILLPVDFDAYRRCSRAFKAVITATAPVMEDRGIDEVYIDFTEVADGQLDGGRVLAQRLQHGIFEATGLTCSIGVAPNKLLAKMASEFHKPKGIAIVHEGDLQDLIWPLPCRKINGIGPKTGEKLEAFGVHTIGDLAAQPLAFLLEHFGPSQGRWLHDAAWGRDERPVQTHSEPVSMSRETTFERNLHPVRDRAELSAVFVKLADQVAADLQRKGYWGRTVAVKLRFDDFRILTRHHSLPEPVDQAGDILRAAREALKRAPLERPLRLLGVRVDGLQRKDTHARTDALSQTAAPSQDRQPCLF